MSRINILGFDGLGLILNSILDPFIQLFYLLYFGFVKAIAWTLDMLTQLFFIFSGMTPVSSTTKINEATGEYYKNDILNMFIQDKAFTKAYFWLCIIALGLIIAFTIGKIIKQDYFDRSGPRSKAPIFRSVFLSFIAFICVIPVFMFLVQAAGALAMLVMRVLGYKGGGVGTLVFNLAWDDNGELFRTVAESYIGNEQYDPQNFGWLDNPYTFYEFFWDSWRFEVKDEINIQGKIFDMPSFYWWVFIFTGLALVLNLGKMMLAMVSRLYKLIALFLIAPSPISQIVLDDGMKFKKWKDMVLQEALKVVGCVMEFLIFLMIASAMPDIDFMRFAFNAPESASAISLIGGNNLTTELSNSVSSLYYSSTGVPTGFDNAVNSLARCMLLIAGVGAIQDMDSVITPLMSGGVSSMDMGHAGGAVANAGMAAAKGAWELGKLTAKSAVKLGSMAASAAAAKGGAGKGIGDALSKDAAAGAAAKGAKGAASKGDGGNGADPAIAPGKDDQNGNIPKTEEEAQKGVETAEQGLTEAENEENEAKKGVEEAETAENEAKNGVEKAETAENEANKALEEAEKGNDPEKIEAAKKAQEEAQNNSAAAKKKHEEAQNNSAAAKKKHEEATKKREEAKKNLDIAKQQQKVTKSSKKRDEAKKTLDQVKARDRKLKRISDDIENIQKSQSMTKEEKEERIRKLEAESEQIKASGPKDSQGNDITLERAQNDYEAANTAYQQDNRELVGMGGKDNNAAIPVQAVTQGPGKSGDNLADPQGGSSQAQQSGGSQEQGGGQGTEQGGSSQGQQSQTSGAGGSTGTPSKYSEAAMRQKEKAARGVKAAQVAKGIAVGYVKYGWHGAKTTYKAASIIGQTLLRMGGLGKVADEIKAAEKDVEEGVHKTFGKDAKTGKYHTPLGEALGKTKDRVSNWASAESQMNRHIDKINQKYDKADERVQTAARTEAATQMMANGDFNQNIQNVADYVNDNKDNMSTDDMLNYSQSMINNSQQMSVVAQAAGGAPKQEMNEATEARQQLLTAQRHLQEAKGTSGESQARQEVQTAMASVASTSSNLNNQSKTKFDENTKVKPKKMAKVERRIARRDEKLATYNAQVERTNKLLDEAREMGVDQTRSKLFERNENRLEKNQQVVEGREAQVPKSGRQSRASSRQITRRTRQAERIGNRIARVTAKKQMKRPVTDEQRAQAVQDMEEEYNVTFTKKESGNSVNNNNKSQVVPEKQELDGTLERNDIPKGEKKVINVEVEVGGNGKQSETKEVKPETKQTLVKNKPNARTNNVIKIKTATQIHGLEEKNVISTDLAEAHFTGLNNNVRKGSKAKNELFAEKVKAMDVESDVHMSEQQLRDALANVVKPAGDEYDDDEHYRNDVEERYTSAKREYQNRIEEAKQHIERFQRSQDVESLKAAREAIAFAVDKSIEIHSIKVEIDNNKK